LNFFFLIQVQKLLHRRPFDSSISAPCLIESSELPVTDLWDFYPERDHELTEEESELSLEMTLLSLAILPPFWVIKLV